MKIVTSLRCGLLLKGKSNKLVRNIRLREWKLLRSSVWIGVVLYPPQAFTRLTLISDPSLFHLRPVTVPASSLVSRWRAAVVRIFSFCVLIKATASERRCRPANWTTTFVLHYCVLEKDSVCEISEIKTELLWI